VKKENIKGKCTKKPHKTNKKEKNRKREKGVHIRKTTIDLCAYMIRLIAILFPPRSLLHPMCLPPTDLIHSLGQKLGRVYWTLIQHSYLLLTCVPQIYNSEPSQSPTFLSSRTGTLFAITHTLFGLSHRPPFDTSSAGKNLVRAG
jgi:hypothetical protein